MNTQQRILLIIALIAAGGIALLVYAMSGNKPVPVVIPQKTSTEQVLVAAADIAPGQPLQSNMVTWQTWPESHLPKMVMTGNGAAALKSHIKGTVARVHILKGMPILHSMLLKAQGHGYMATILKPNMRAISLPMSVDRAVAGFVRPNNYVDLLLTRSHNGHPETHKLLGNVLLLAIDQLAEDNPNPPYATGSLHTITVEVTPEQAELLTKAHMTGTISLALRPLALTAGADKYDKSGPITIIRGGPAPDAGK